MPKTLDQRRGIFEREGCHDTAAPLEFEKISVEDARRVFDQAGASRPEANESHRVSDDDILLDATATWLTQLPVSVRPLQLCRRHPRMGNTLAMVWKQRMACESYFRELLSAHQADRAPSSQAIVSELSGLRAYYDKLQAEGGGFVGNEPLRAVTIAWLEQLPEHVRPLELAQQFPRIANKLCEVWKQPSACERYIDGLVVDGRGGRKGFPPKVAIELTELRAYYVKLYPSDHGKWNDGQFMR